MTALVISLFLGLYVLLPVLIFDKTLAFFVPAKKFNRSRTEELAFGSLVVLVPLVLTFLLSHAFWTVGHHPFALNEAQDRSKGEDYRMVLMALQSDRFLEANEGRVWQAIAHVERRQLRFLCWMYLLLAAECGLVILLLSRYGAWRRYGVYRWISSPLLKRVSPWHILFTTYTFDPKQPHQVEVDVLTAGELYSGHMGPEHYLVNPDGSLNGLLLTQTRRYRRKELIEDRGKGIHKPAHTYWSPIAGEGQFYIPFSTVSNINIRYTTSEVRLRSELEKEVRQNQEIVNALQLDGLAGLEVTFSREPFSPDAEPVEEAEGGSGDGSSETGSSERS
jgi:hypothetical protein